MHILDIAKNTEHACADPEPRVRFREFGDSGLKFQLLFWIEKPVMRGRCIDKVSSIIHKQFNKEKLIIDYKSGAVAVSKMVGNPIELAQLPIYAISHDVDGVSFAAINSTDCQFKAITKNKSALPLKPQTKSKMPEWDIQLMEWHSALNSASKDFQNGIAKVLPAKNACKFCDYDLLCRVEKSPNHR